MNEDEMFEMVKASFEKCDKDKMIEFTSALLARLATNGVSCSCEFEPQVIEGVSDDGCYIAKIFAEYKKSPIRDTLFVNFSEHDKEFADEIEKLQSEVEKYHKAFEEEKKKCDFQICKYQKKVEELEQDLKTAGGKIQDTDFLPTEPIKVADMLINASKKRTNCMTGKEYDKYIFEKWQLRQIAEHLLVYCNHNGEAEE